MPLKSCAFNLLLIGLLVSGKIVTHGEQGRESLSINMTISDSREGRQSLLLMSAPGTSCTWEKISTSPVGPGIESKCLGVLDFHQEKWCKGVPMHIRHLCFLPSLPTKNTQRNPMFVFVFVGALFRLSVKAPALVPLFQFPPRSAAPPEKRRFNSTPKIMSSMLQKIVWLGPFWTEVVPAWSSASTS